METVTIKITEAELNLIIDALAYKRADYLKGQQSLEWRNEGNDQKHAKIYGQKVNQISECISNLTSSVEWVNKKD